MMKKLLTILILLVSTLFIFSACGNKKDGEIRKKSNRCNLSDIQSEFNEIKKHTYKNLDFSQAGLVNHSDISCYKLTIKQDWNKENFGMKKMNMEEVLKKFESYCVNYFGVYDEKYVIFAPLADSNYYDELCGDIEKAETADKFFPKVNEYKDELINGTYKATSLYYYDNDHKRYVYWTEASSEPEWINRGKLYSLYSDAKLGSWLPKDIDDTQAVKKIYTGDFDKGYDQEYRIGNDKMTLREVISYIENGNQEGEMNPYVYKVKIYDMKDGSDSIGAEYTDSFHGIPMDSFQESVTNADTDLVQESKELVVDGKGHLDVRIDGGSPDITSKTEVVPLINLTKAVNILSNKVTQSVKFKITSVAMVYTGKYTDENCEKADLSPAWKFIADNSNDGLHYAFYVDVVTGKLYYYSYSTL